MVSADMEKLIRTKLRLVIEEGDKHKEPEERATFRIADFDEQLGLLVSKLGEEYAEFKEAFEQDDLPEMQQELADILQVIDSLFVLKGLDPITINHLKAVKLRKRGGFNERVVANFPDGWEIPKKEA